MNRLQEFHELAKHHSMENGEHGKDFLSSPPRQRSPFFEDALATLHKIEAMARFLRDHHAAYVLDDGLYGMSDEERDEMDKEGESSLAICSTRIEQLKQLAIACQGDADGPGRQRALVHQAMVQLLFEQLKEVAGVFDEHRRLRIQRAAEARERLLGMASAAQLQGRAGLSCAGGLSEQVSEVPWVEGEVLSDEDLDEDERQQLHLENEALRHELSCMVEQAKEAESSMMQISNLSNLFASKVAEQEREVDWLFSHAEQTSENLVRGNQYLDSAARHSRDFRMLALSFLVTASFSLLFLDWYYV
mmetsp:Transcript_5043/g.11013  ORF Transcript_5043/g.11013 Transcript_5043/m.11013 type:complete len:304 (+) Transcript_5043:178-1089(+)